MEITVQLINKGDHWNVNIISYGITFIYRWAYESFMDSSSPFGYLSNLSNC